MIAALFAALLFYLFPLMTGRLVAGPLGRRFVLPYRLILWFAAGSLVLYGAALGSVSLVRATLPQLLNAGNVQLVAIVTLAALIITNLFLGKRDSRLRGNDIQAGVLLFGAAAVVYALWRLHSPYAMPLNWDIHEHQVLVNEIAKGNLFYETSNMSDTFLFNGYSTLFHVLAALPQIVFKPNPLSFWWMVEYLHLATTIGISWLIAFAATRNKWVAAIAAAIGALTFESSVAYTSLFLIPQTLAATLAAGTLALVVEEHHANHKTPWIVLALMAVTLGLMHYIVGAAAIALLVAALIAIRLKLYRHMSGLILLTLNAIFILVCLVYGITTTVNLASLNFGEAAMFMHTFTQNLTFFQTFYGTALMILFPLGIIAAYQNRHEGPFLLGMLSLIVWVIILAPLPYVLKFYVLNRYMVHVVMALGLWTVVKDMVPTARTLVLALVGMALATVFVVNISQWQQLSVTQGVATQVSGDEQTAAMFLEKQNDATTTLLVSDPATQAILESQSGVNSQGGAYMNHQTRPLLAAALTSTTSAELARALAAIDDTVAPTKPTVVYLVISGRTMLWKEFSKADQQNIAVNVWNPQPFSYDMLVWMGMFEKEHEFTPVFTNGAVRIYRIVTGGKI